MTNDAELENTLKNIKKKTGFFRTFGDREHGWMWNGYPVKISGGTEVEINVKKSNITRGIQKVITDTSNIPLKKTNDKDNEIFINILQSFDFENYKAIPAESKSSGNEQSKTNFKKRVKTSDLEGHGVKTVLPSNIIAIYTRFENLLG